MAAAQTLEMPVVRNGETGLELLAENAEHFIRRVVAEEDFAGSADSEVRASERRLDTFCPRICRLYLSWLVYTLC